MNDFCPECLKKDQAKEFADRDHKEQIEKLAAQAANAESRVKAAEDKAASPKELPDFNDFITHCKDCSHHKPQLEAYNENLLKGYVDNMTPEVAAQIAQAKGVELMPEKVELGPGITRRLKT